MRNGIFSERWMFDIDDSILHFMPSFLEFYNWRNFDRHPRRFNVKDMFSYDMEVVFKIPKKEVAENVLEFYHTYECHHLEPLTGAYNLLSQVREPLAITARPSEVRKITEYNLNHRFGAYSPKVLFAKSYNSFLGISPEEQHTKAELCQMHRIRYALEDSALQSNELSNVGVNVFLVNQPWNAKAITHPSVTRINSINEILS